jgi:polyferredoxin
MEIERETLVQVAISTLGFVTFVGAAMYVASTYSTNGGLSEQGGVAIVGAIGLFVVVMLGAGLWMERQRF